MTFRLICQEGPRKGQEYLVKESVQVGRSVGDIQLKDSKCSNPHAKIFNDTKGLLQIEDLSSSHGTWVNGIKISSVTALKEGDKLMLGKSILEVAEAVSEKKDPEPVKGTWQEKLEMDLNSALMTVENGPSRVGLAMPFNEPVVLEFAQGIQTGQTLVFGFGPRSIGRLCNDGLLVEERAPPVAFELHPTPGHLCELKAKSENIQVNGVEVKVQKIKSGDRVSFGQTAIVIRTYKPL